MKYAKRINPRLKRPRYTLTQLLTQMPDVGLDEDFARSNDVLYVWDEMIPVDKEFGAVKEKSPK